MNKKLILFIQILLCLSYQITNKAYSQTDPHKEILVCINPSFIDFPDSTSASYALSSSGIISTSLFDAFNNWGVSTMKRTFPQFTKQDTLKFNNRGESINTSIFSRIFTLELKNEVDVDTLLNLLNSMENEVFFAEKNCLDSMFIGTNDPDYYKQWYLKNNGQAGGISGKDIKIEPAWNFTQGSPNLTIGVMDQGADLNHVDLSGRIYGDSYIGSSYSHGTQMCGIIGAITNNSYNTKGINWNSPIKSYKIYDSDLSVNISNWANQIMDACYNCKVINISSFGNIASYSFTIHEAFKFFSFFETTVVACMGNNSGGTVNWPACFNGVIAVGATDNRDDIPTYSNYQSYIDLVAPGGASLTSQDEKKIFTLQNNSSSGWTNGTSEATAVVSGVSSLLRSYRNLFKDDVEGILRASADKFSGQTEWNQYQGDGRINSERALQYLRSPYIMTNYPTTVNNQITGGSIYHSQEFWRVHISDNYYKLAIQNEVHKTVNFTVPNGHSLVSVWGRSYGSPSSWWTNWTSGWGDDIFVKKINGLDNAYISPTPYCQLVPGSLHLTGTSSAGTTYEITLKTYTYSCFTKPCDLCQLEYVGTYPVENAGDITNWQFTVLTKNNRLKWADATVVNDNQQIIFEPGVSEAAGRVNDSTTDARTINDFYVTDSSKVILKDSAILQLPDNYTLHIGGKTSSLILKPNSKIQFGENSKIIIDSNATFIADGATFESLDSTKKWNGLILKNADSVNINNCIIKNVDAENNSGYAINLINAKVINIDSCMINNVNSSAGGIQVHNVSYLATSPEINITNNTIKIQTDTCDGITITPYGWLTVTGYISGNKIINTSSGGGRYGIYGFDLVGTPIKNNYIENFENGIVTWYSSLDLFENTIDTKNISGGWDLYGIVSEYNLSNAFDSRLGGSNVLTTFNGRNICLDALDLNIAEGNNIFNLKDESGYHLAGYFPTPPDSNHKSALGNCFLLNGMQGDEFDIKRNVTWSDGTTHVVFDFSFNSCLESPNYCNFYLGVNPSDTVWIECAGGMGGGFKEGMSISSENENAYQLLYDTLNINMRKKEYRLAADKCMTLLDDYTNSAKTINVVDKLYHTALATNSVSELKSYYESFILSHPDNVNIIQRMFYYIQKAKVALGQYESAMTGFQTIMTEFPTSFEGLAAKWDYMAAQVLSTSGGQGGSEKETTINEKVMTDEQRHERLVSLVEDPLDKYDKKKFSKEDRKVIATNIVSSFEGKKTKEANRYMVLETKINMSEASASEKQEYYIKSVLKEMVRVQKVRTVDEHISAVQNDIKKISNIKKAENDTYTKRANSVPGEYKLNQNYPNPFNPSTKINYELKNAGFVSLKIYDLLGREIAELVNMNQDAGRYVVDFNASKYMMASGIYFYRIKAGEFIDTKRMVLVK